MKYFKLFLLLILAAGLFWGIRYIRAQNSTPTVPKYNPKKDKIISPQIKDLKDEITLTGSIAAADIATLRFQTSGKLAWVGVRVGDRVKKGQAIASLDKQELRKDLDKELNDYRAALHNFNDTQDTYKETKQRFLVTDSIQRILDRAQYTLNNQVIDYELSELTLKLATIYSPLAGVVTALDQPLAGVNITPATATFTIINPQSVYLAAQIDQEEVAKIRLNQPATIKLDSFPHQTIDSQITYISFTPIAGNTSTVYEVRLELPLANDDLTYRLGMDGDAIINLSESLQALTLPTDAILEDNGQKYVYLLRGKELHRQNITPGLETDTDTQILAGLTLNDQVIIKQK